MIRTIIEEMGERNFFDSLHNQNKVNIALVSDDDVVFYEVDGDVILVIKVPKARREEKPLYVFVEVSQKTFTFKRFYYRGLSEWQNEKGWLTDTCLDGQDTFIRLLDMLDIPHQ